MKKVFLRTFALFLAIFAGTVIFLFLIFLGDKSKGPLQDIFSTVNSGFASFEKKFIGKARENRSASLNWFDKYRNNIVSINYPDTILLGAYDDRTLESYESIVALEDSLQLKLPIIQLYTAWGSKKEQVFPDLRAHAIYDLGSMPMITWEPWLDDFDPQEFPVDANAENKNLGGLKAIADGKFDKYIDKWARDAKKFGAPFFLRFAHEMNDPYRYPWGPQNNKPADFIAAWKHVVNRFNYVGAKNAVWLWSPHPAYTTYTQFYPGNEYVDWIGATCLNYGTVAQWSKWYSFDDIFGKFYKDFSYYEKPVMIAECGTLAVGGDRATWFRDAITNLPVKYPAVKALLFYHNSNDNTTSYKNLSWGFKNDAKVVEAIKGSLKNWKKATKK